MPSTAVQRAGSKSSETGVVTMSRYPARARVGRNAAEMAERCPERGTSAGRGRATSCSGPCSRWVRSAGSRGGVGTRGTSRGTSRGNPSRADERAGAHSRAGRGVAVRRPRFRSQPGAAGRRQNGHRLGAASANPVPCLPRWPTRGHHRGRLGPRLLPRRGPRAPHGGVEARWRAAAAPPISRPVPSRCRPPAAPRSARRSGRAGRARPGCLLPAPGALCTAGPPRRP